MHPVRNAPARARCRAYTRLCVQMTEVRFPLLSLLLFLFLALFFYSIYIWNTVLWFFCFFVCFFLLFLFSFWLTPLIQAHHPRKWPRLVTTDCLSVSSRDGVSLIQRHLNCSQRYISINYQYILLSDVIILLCFVLCFLCANWVFSSFSFCIKQILSRRALCRTFIKILHRVLSWMASKCFMWSVSDACKSTRYSQARHSIKLFYFIFKI